MNSSIYKKSQHPAKEDSQSPLARKRWFSVREVRQVREIEEGENCEYINSRDREAARIPNESRMIFLSHLMNVASLRVRCQANTNSGCKSRGALSKSSSALFRLSEVMDRDFQRKDSFSIRTCADFL